MYRLHIHCRLVEKEALDQLVTAEKAKGKAWLAEHRNAARDRARAADMTVQERDELLDQVAAEFAALQDAGQFRGTHTLFLLPHLRAVVDERGWADRKWRPAPAKSRLRIGRPWGGHDQHFEKRIDLKLPDKLGALIANACYWTSAPSVRALTAWYEKHGDHWRGRAHDPDWIWRGVGPSRADLTAREEHAAKIVTTGDIGREALRRALREGMLNALMNAG